MSRERGGSPIGSLSVGDSVYCNVDGTRTEFLIVHKGNPDTSLYDESCDGVWCLMKDAYSSREWNSGANTYASSAINTWLNDNFLAAFDTSIQAAIKQVKIPYCVKGGVVVPTINAGADGLACKCFLLCGYEVGLSQSINSRLPIDGANLSYFESGAGTSANNKRIAKLNGSPTYWWLRSPDISYSSSVWCIYTNGSYTNAECTESYGIRPAFILPHTAKIDKDNNIIG